MFGLSCGASWASPGVPDGAATSWCSPGSGAPNTFFETWSFASRFGVLRRRCHEGWNTRSDWHAQAKRTPPHGGGQSPAALPYKCYGALRRQGKSSTRLVCPSGRRHGQVASPSSIKKKRCLEDGLRGRQNIDRVEDKFWKRKTSRSTLDSSEGTEVADYVDALFEFKRSALSLESKGRLYTGILFFTTIACFL